MPERRSFTSWAFALLVFLGVFGALFFRVLAGDETLVHGDAISVSLPLQHVLASALADGRIPLWSDQIYGGHPLFAEGQGGFAHPLNYLLFGLLPAVIPFPAGEPGIVAPSTIYGHGLLHVLCGVIAALGVFGLCRAHGLSTVASVVGGLALGCSQDWLWQSSNSAIAGTSAWAPWVLLAVERWWRRPDLASAVLLGFALALMVLAGYPQAIHGVALFALVSVAVRIDRAWLRQPLPHVGTGLLAIVLAAGLSAIQLLPTLELIGESVRAQGVALVSSADPWMQARGLLYSIGDRAAIDPSLGSILLVGLAALASLVVLVRPISRTVLGLVVASALLFQLSAADHSPLYRALHHALPGLDSFRITHLYSTLALIGLAVLAGHGVERLSLLPPLRNVSPRAAGLVTVLLGLLAVACVSLHDELVPSGTYVFPIAAVAGVVALLAARRARFVPSLILAILLAEIATLRAPLHDFASVDVLREPPPIVRAILDRHPGDRHFRLANVPHFFAYVGFASASAPDLDRLAGLFLSSMDAGSNLLWSIPSVNANLALPLGRRSAVEGLIEAEVRGETSRLPGERFIDGFGVRYAVLHKQHRGRPFAPDLSSVYFDEDYRFHLFENLHAEQRFRFVASSDARTVENAMQAVDLLESGNDGSLFVEAAADAFPDDGGNPVRPAATFVTSLVGPERSVAVVDVEVPGFLVIADAMYPGWKALVNGEAAPLFAANAVEKAVPLRAGRHHVELVFESAPFQNGARVSAGSVFAGALLLGLGRLATLRRSGKRPAVAVDEHA